MQFTKWGLKLKSREFIACIVALIMFFSVLGVVNPGTAYAKTSDTPAAESFVVNIYDNGEIIPVHTYTIAEMEALSGNEVVYYSSIDSMPSPKISITKGVTLNDLVADINAKYNTNIIISSSTLKGVKLYATDDWSSIYTYDYLFGTPRFYYPEVVRQWDYDHQMTGPGSDANPVAVEPMFALFSYQERFLTDLDHPMIGPDDEDSATFRFCFGQTKNELIHSTITSSRFARCVNRMDIILPDALDVPTLNPDSTGNVVGNVVEITFNDEQTWREAISTVRVDSTDLTPDEYVIEDGKIIIDGSVFAAAGTYTLVIKASGYGDATVVQRILESIPSETPKYRVTPADDAVYTIGTTPDGLKALTVNPGQSGLKYFPVSVVPVVAHEGNETMVFTHLRNGVQLELNATVADFDVVESTKAGFNVQAGDVIKLYLVDRLDNAVHSNPIILE